jgi:Domain of unknown function (DUF1902)
MAKRRTAVRVRAQWDEEAKVWVAEGTNLPGLVTEAETAELLLDKLHVMVPELLSYDRQSAREFRPEIVLTLVRRDAIAPAAA